MFHVRKQISSVIYLVFQKNKENIATLFFFRSNCKTRSLQYGWKYGEM
jgi:hypothetical protein